MDWSMEWELQLILIDTLFTIPQILFALFQMAFAILTPAIVSGGIEERTRFPAYCLFILLWGTLVS